MCVRSPSASFRSSLSLSRSRIMPTVGRADDSTAEHGSAIGTLGATLLARGLANNRGLLSLCVASNDIGDDGLSALCDALKTGVCPLRILDVSDNPCGPKASAALLAAAKGSDSLMDVTMTGWELPPEHARQLGTYRVCMELVALASASCCPVCCLYECEL